MTLGNLNEINRHLLFTKHTKVHLRYYRMQNPYFCVAIISLHWNHILVFLNVSNRTIALLKDVVITYRSCTLKEVFRQTYRLNDVVILPNGSIESDFNNYINTNLHAMKEKVDNKISLSEILIIESRHAT